MECINVVAMVRRLLSIVTRRMTLDSRNVLLIRVVHAELTLALLFLVGMQLRLRIFNASLGMSIPFRLERCVARMKNVLRTTLTVCTGRPGGSMRLIAAMLASYNGTVLHCVLET